MGLADATHGESGGVSPMLRTCTLVSISPPPTCFIFGASMDVLGFYFFARFFFKSG
jgi:hypothetical protein